MPFCAGHRWIVLGDRASVLGTLDRHLKTLLLVHIEHNATETRAGGEVDVQDGLLGASQRVDSAADEIFATRREDLEPDIVGGDTGLFDEAAGKVEVCLRCGGKRHFNLFVADIHKHLEETIFLLAIHWVGKGLIAIAQVGS